MKRTIEITWFAWVALLMIAPTISFAQAQDSGLASSVAYDPYPPVLQYDLSGPRFGVTLSPEGRTRSQFGWHAEHQVAPSNSGPAFLIETVFLVGGFENRQFVPNGTLLFGMRTPSGLEFGLGPSATFGLKGFRTSVVFAVGQTLKVGGIRVPLNVALAADRDGQRLSLMTGWAVRNPLVPGR